MAVIRTPKEAEEYLARLTNYERIDASAYTPERWGLGRMMRLADAAGAPHRGCPAVHIAGTKGKGSTALLLESILQAEGIPCGTYLSPHLVRLEERIRCDGREITGEELAAALDAVGPRIEEMARAGDPPTFFEVLTILAMGHFRSRRAAVAIYEVGLGGRLDATNIILPDVCVITQIGLDHTQQLGATLAEIAREKAGIAKPGRPLVLGPVPGDVEEVIAGRCGEVGAPLWIWEDTIVADEGNGAFRVRVPGSGRIYPGLSLGVLGEHQRTNAALAVQARDLLPLSFPEPGAVARGLREARLPARQEIIPGRPAVLVDSAHTEESVRALADTIRARWRPEEVQLLLAVARDKAYSRWVPLLSAVAGRITLTRADPVRGADPHDLARLITGPRVDVIEPAEAAVRHILYRLGPEDTLCATGSFYLAGVVRQVLREEGRIPAGPGSGEIPGR